MKYGHTLAVFLLKNETMAKIMKNHFSFFENHIRPKFRMDTNTVIGETMIALAYPSLIIIGPPPFFKDAVIDVKKEGLEIEPDKYSLFQFLVENPEFCKIAIESYAGLMKLWQEFISAECSD